MTPTNEELRALADRLSRYGPGMRPTANLTPVFQDCWKAADTIERLQSALTAANERAEKAEADAQRWCRDAHFYESALKASKTQMQAAEATAGDAVAALNRTSIALSTAEARVKALEEVREDALAAMNKIVALTDTSSTPDTHEGRAICAIMQVAMDYVTAHHRRARAALEGK